MLLTRRLRGDERGSTAVEFAIVALPFLLLLVGLMSVSLYFFTNFTMESAVLNAARAIRTGQLQQGQGAYTGMTTNEDKRDAFKATMCSKAPTFLDCANRAVVLVQSSSTLRRHRRAELRQATAPWSARPRPISIPAPPARWCW